MLSLKKTKNNFGFTVIELIVSAGIIALVSVLVIVNLRGTNQKSSLDNEADRISSIIRTAHINSIIGLTVNGTRPLGGFGIHLIECETNCTYFLFADDNGNYEYDGDPPDVLIQAFNMLDDNVYIDNLSSGNNLDITFTPPEGEIYIDASHDDDEAVIILRFTDTSYTRQITINRFTGRIDIQ